MAFRFASYQSATTDSGGPTPGTLALRRYCLARWDFASFMGLYNPRNVRGGSRLSHHAEGRALDIGIIAADAEIAAGARRRGEQLAGNGIDQGRISGPRSDPSCSACAERRHPSPPSVRASVETQSCFVT